MDEFAPGIKEKGHYPELPHVKEPTKWEWVIHSHDAKKKGLHNDIRLGDPKSGHGYSWAMPPKMPGPGESAYCIEQSVHSIPYFDFKGTIEDGYGAGKVDIAERGKAEIVNARPGHISFNIYRGYGPEEFSIHKMGDRVWKIFNKTISKDKIDLPLHKPKYRETDIEGVDNFGDDYIMSAKIDDAHNLFYFGAKDDPLRVFSYKESKRSPSKLIEHSHKLDLDIKTPKDLKDTVVRGGIYAIDKRTGSALQNAILGGILNSSVWKSREKQEEYGKLKPIIYDIDRYKGKDVSTLPYGEKLKLLKDINEKFPQLEIPSMAHSSSDKEKLLREIKEGKHPETSEGVVLQHLYESKPPIKAKVIQEHDVYIRDFFPADGKYKGTHSGGFYYSHSENGSIAGKVGTGFSDALRKDMHNHPEKYRGLVAVTKSMSKYESEALRQPSFSHWHPDKGGDKFTEDIILK